MIRYLLKSAGVGILGVITACVVVVIAQNRPKRDGMWREYGKRGWTR